MASQQKKKHLLPGLMMVRSLSFRGHAGLPAAKQSLRCQDCSGSKAAHDVALTKMCAYLLTAGRWRSNQLADGSLPRGTEQEGLAVVCRGCVEPVAVRQRLPQ